MRFLSLVLRNVLQRRLRSLLTICGVATAVAAVVALVGIARNYERPSARRMRRAELI